MKNKTHKKDTLVLFSNQILKLNGKKIDTCDSKASVEIPLCLISKIETKDDGVLINFYDKGNKYSVLTSKFLDELFN